MDKKRGALILLVSSLILALFSTLVSADYSTSVFNGNTFSGTSIDMDDYTIIVTMNYNQNRMFVDAGDDFASVPIFECGTLKNIKVCFTNTTFDEEELRTYMVLQINKTEPSITITRTITETEFYAGEEQNVTISVTNSGDTATDVTYYEDWGSEFEIIAIEDGPCNIERSAIIWKGYLTETRSLDCLYRIRAKDEVHKSVAASLKYFNGYKMETEYASELVIDAEPLVEILYRAVHEEEQPEEATFDWETDSVSPAVGEEFKLGINLTNKLSATNEENPSWVDVYLTLQYPQGLDYKGPGYIFYKEDVGTSGNYTNYTTHRVSSSGVLTKQLGNVLEWSGRLNNNASHEASETFVLNFIGKKIGANNILLTAHYTDENGGEYTHSEYIKLDIGVRGMKTILYINDLAKRFEREEHLEDEDEIDLESLNEYKLRMQIENVNPYGIIKNVEVSVDPENFTVFETKSISSIVKDGYWEPYEFMFTAPRTAADQNYDIKVTVTALTEFGERFTNTSEFTVSLNKFDDIEINHEFETTSLEGDEESMIVTNLKNNRLVDIHGVRVWDYIDPRFAVDGVHERMLTLKADEEVDIYSYTVTAPRIGEKDDEFIINTTLSYYDPDYNINITQTKESKMTVEPKELDI
ncbi:hypothetical protein ACFL96_15565, partial [Thermoproteota archaeon]